MMIDENEFLIHFFKPPPTPVGCTNGERLCCRQIGFNGKDGQAESNYMLSP
jgi:hypothetical protein